MHDTAYEPTTDEPVSAAVVRALAAATDTDPTDVDLRLYDAVDPDALDALYPSGRRADLEVTFTLGEFEVTVEDTRRVTVRPAGDSAGVDASARPPFRPSAAAEGARKTVSEN